MVDETDTNSAAAGAKPKAKPRRPAKPGRKKKKKGGRPVAGAGAFPRHTVRKALRVPRAILDQNAGKPCSDREAAGFCGVKILRTFRS